MPDIIQLHSLTKTFGRGTVAVDNIDLAVGEGEFVTLLGPSGCGKTTTLRMIAGFEIPTRGRIYLSGEDVTDLPPYQRHVNTVFQDYALFPHMSVSENVGYGLRVGGVPKGEIIPRVTDTLNMVGLVDKARHRPNRLSGGEKQRVALARALVRKPKVLLLDEPLSALDAKLRGAMQVELKHLHQKLGITFLYVTHDQTEAMVMSDRIIVMDRGRIAQSGSPADLYDHPATPYVANFLGSSNMIASQVVEVRPDGLRLRVGTWVIACRANGQSFTEGEQVTVSIRPEKVAVVDDGGSAPDGFNVIEGVVRDYLFHGNSYRIEVDIGQDTPFIVDVQLQTGVDRAAIPMSGSAVAIAFDPANVNAFAAGADR